MRLITIVTILSFCFNSCKGQSNEKKYASIDFFKHIYTDYIDIMQFKFNNIEITTPHYELNASKIKIGEACLFAITKEYPEEWVKGALTGECSKKAKQYGSLICRAKQLFSTDTLVLKQSLDLYIFFIDKKDLEGPFLEEAEGGTSENYDPKPNGTIIIYKYDEKGWLKIDSAKNSEIPRFFGESYMKILAEERINKYLKKGK
jgi:hypothetical protein